MKTADCHLSVLFIMHGSGIMNCGREDREFDSAIRIPFNKHGLFYEIQDFTVQWIKRNWTYTRIENVREPEGNRMHSPTGKSSAIGNRIGGEENIANERQIKTKSL